MATLHIIRGLPGSGKTTYAKKRFNCLHLEADMFFEHDGKYEWKPGGDNHTWCQDTCREALRNGMDVVVSNTFTTKSQIMPYQAMADVLGAKFEVLTMTSDFGNVHDVPQDTLDEMKRRWEAWPSEKLVSPDGDILDDKPSPIVAAMNKSKFVRKRELHDGIVSYNYSRKAFYNGQWNRATTTARGLFMRGNDIVARSFDKFFRVGERAETTPEAIFKSIDFSKDRIDLYEKFNGYLGIVSFDEATMKWFVASKSTDSGPYADNLRRILTEMNFFDRVPLTLRGCFSFVFEVVDTKHDPHFVDYSTRGGEMAYLIGVFPNTFTDPEVAIYNAPLIFGSWIGEFIYPYWTTDLLYVTGNPFTDESKFRKNLSRLVAYDIVDSVVPGIEGFVLTVTKSDGPIHRVDRYKLKNANYCFWKYVRGRLGAPDAWGDDGKLVIAPYKGKPSELVAPTPLMDWAVDVLRSMSKDDFERFKFTDFGNFSRINMIELAKYVDNEIHKEGASR